ncbi:MAG: hypothetical protein ABI867_25865 [Kofleriaceae bacterium]
MTNVTKLALPALLCATACIPTHEYEGDYEMTYDVIMRLADNAHESAVAGRADVEIRKGLNTEYLVDLGASFCRLQGTSVLAKDIDEWPYLDIRPQACWFELGDGKAMPMELTGTATFDEREDRLSIVLTGTYEDATKQSLGAATVELSESY